MEFRGVGIPELILEYETAGSHTPTVSSVRAPISKEGGQPGAARFMVSTTRGREAVSKSKFQ